jgi:hypothetical protein
VQSCATAPLAEVVKSIAARIAVTYKPGFPIWVRLTRFSVPQNRSEGNPVSFGNEGMSLTLLKFARQASLVEQAMLQRPAVQGLG